jgi:hypothetical protein
MLKDPWFRKTPAETIYKILSQRHSESWPNNANNGNGTCKKEEIN